jgi:hypothetical protein
MPDTTAHIRNAITDLEAERRRIENALSGLRKILVSLDEGAAAVVESKAAAPAADSNGSGDAAVSGGAFEPKYSHSADNYVAEVLQAEDGWISTPQINKELKRRGYQFHRETVAYALKKLEKAGRAERRASPKGSRSRWDFRAKATAQEVPK